MFITYYISNIYNFVHWIFVLPTSYIEQLLIHSYFKKVVLTPSSTFYLPCFSENSLSLLADQLKWCPWHRKASAKTQVSLTRFLQSEVKIIHIIVQNNTNWNSMSAYIVQKEEKLQKSVIQVWNIIDKSYKSAVVLWNNCYLYLIWMTWI